MNNEIKEILDRIETASEIFDCLLKPEECTELLDYITNLQQEKDNLYLDNTMLKLEKDIYKQGYEELKEIIGNYVNVVLHDRKVIDDYKSRCEKADNQLKIIMQILKEQPNRSIKDDEWLENRLIGVVNILQNGSDEE